MYLEIPETFTRHVDNLKQTGESLLTIFRIIYLVLLTAAIMVVVNRRGSVVLSSVKWTYIWCGGVLFLLLAATLFNDFSLILFQYPTSQSLHAYFIRQCIEGLVSPFFIVLSFILPCLAGEALREERNDPAHRSFFAFIQSHWMTRDLTSSIMAGYLAVCFILGFQALIFVFGFQFCGVWQEMSWMTQTSSAVFPALTALAMAFQASLSEETTFRLFGIQIAMKYGRSIVLAVFISSVVWGFGHTGYLVFPMWFRGLEVSLLGIVFAVVYLRFGLVTSICAHFLMDAFLMSMPYLIRPKWSSDFIASLAILAMPALIACVAYAYNLSTTLRPLTLKFNAEQLFNLFWLKDIFKRQPKERLNELKEEFIKHGWDPTVVRKAQEESD